MPKAVEIRNIEGMSPSDMVETMTGWSPFELWRCEGDDESGVQCQEMATLDLGNPSKIQVCDRCAQKLIYRRLRVREPMHHSERLKREYRESRRRYAPSPTPGIPHER